MEHVGAESAFANGLLQVLVSRCQEAHVEPDSARAADADEFALLKDAQQLGLQSQRKLADFVEENASAFGDFQQTFLLTDGAGECSFLVPEQLAFQKRFRQRGAVQGHKRLILAGAILMNGASSKLLARATFAVNQDSGFTGGDLLDKLVDLAHARALADHIVLQADLGAQTLILAAQALKLARVLDGNGGDSGDGGEKLQIVFGESRAGICGIEIDGAQGAAGYRQRNTEERAHSWGVIVGSRTEFADFIVEDGESVLDHAAHQ